MLPCAGAPGLVRIEAPRGSSLGQGSGSTNESVFTGLTPWEAEDSVAFSKPIALGVGPGGAVLTHDLEITRVAVREGEFGQPGDTRATVLWWIGGMSRNQHGRVDEAVFHMRPEDAVAPSQGTQELTGVTLQEFVRFEVRLSADPVTREVPSLRRIELEYCMRE